MPACIRGAQHAPAHLPPLQGSCKVTSQCHQIRDPCRTYSTNWACLADPACRLVPASDMAISPATFTSTDSTAAYLPLLGTRCVSATDWCSSLVSDQDCAAASTQGCAAVPSCVSSYCAAAGDACCEKAGSVTCSADPSCQAGSQCVPVVDECASILSKAGCTVTPYCK
jgi:hypothetical protein